MEPERIVELRRWAKALADRGDAAEARAAGRAILLLVGEVERLQGELEHAERDSGPGGGGEAPARPTGRRLGERRSRGRRREPPGDAVAATAVPREASVRRRPAANGNGRGSSPAPERPADRPPRATGSRVRRERSRRSPASFRPALRIVLPLALLGALVLGGWALGARIAAPDLELVGPADGAALGPDQLRGLAFSVAADPADALADARLTLDGRDVTASARRVGERLVLRPKGIPDGEHRLVLDVPVGFPGAESGHEWRFSVDTTAPPIRLDRPDVGYQAGLPMRLTGRVEDAVSLTAGGTPVKLDKGRFSIAFGEPPRQRVVLAARDDVGNANRRALSVKVVPRRPGAPVRGVHVTFHAWADPTLRRDVLQLIRERRINTVELDLKDESGVVGFDADIPFGKRIGAVQSIYDLDGAVKQLHAQGVRVVGRLVAFRDPVHAKAAWKAGNRKQVVQTPSGEPYAPVAYGGFTNFADPVVQQYNIDVARAAAQAGVDDILYDYIRRPDGPIGSMVFPGLRGPAEQAIAEFLAKSRRQLRPYRVYVGASVFGVAATRPEEVAQDIPSMARELDYIAPMVYPSHWGPGEYNVASPNSQPYDIVARSLRDFTASVEGTGARVVPWLQDFSLGVTYGPAEVRAQIDAARDAGVREWILWDPAVTYTGAALGGDAARFKRLATPHAGPLPPAKPEPKQGARSAPAAPSRAQAVRANELGVVPVIMYHQIREDGGDYDLTAAEFRAELGRLHRAGYRPVRAIDLVTGRLNVPAGKSPVVLTFDDSTKEQFSYGSDGKIAPGTALGIMQDFARTHPDFRPVGTFYVNREPFAGVAEGPEMLRYLAENGFELGNHTHDHIPFTDMPRERVQRALVLGKQLIVRAVPGTPVRTLALPLGVMPEPASVARRGSWGGDSYSHAGVFLVGAEPAPSPFSKLFRPGAIPRIRTAPEATAEYGSAFWLDFLRKHPERRYVSDGDPDRISFPASRSGELAARYRSRANPY